eukprot:3822029-Amphidinium_carterae.1
MDRTATRADSDRLQRHQSQMSTPMTLSGISCDLVTGRIQWILAIRVCNLSLPIRHTKWQKLIVVLMTPLDIKT